MTKPRPRVVIEGAKGRVVIRSWGNGYRIKATAYSGDAALEMRLAAHAVNLMQESVRAVTGDPDLLLKPGPIRHIDDHDICMSPESHDEWMSDHRACGCDGTPDLT